jgi:hypothetical protein
LLTVCDESTTRQTRVFSLRLAGHVTAELPLREPRRQASAVATPLGTLAILGGELLAGGEAMTIESYFPE